MSRLWSMRIVAAIAAWVVALFVARLLQVELRPWLLGVLVAAAACGGWLVLDLSASMISSRWRQERTDPVRPPGEDRRLEALVRHLNKNFDAVDAGKSVHTDLVAVVDDRLMAKYGLSRVSDPERAADVLGSDVAVFLDRDQRSRLSIEEIDHVLNRIESL